MLPRGMWDTMRWHRHVLPSKSLPHARICTCYMARHVGHEGMHGSIRPSHCHIHGLFLVHVLTSYPCGHAVRDIFTSYPCGHAVRCTFLCYHQPTSCLRKQARDPTIIHVCGGLPCPATSKGEIIGGHTAKRGLPELKAVMVSENTCMHTILI